MIRPVIGSDIFTVLISDNSCGFKFFNKRAIGLLPGIRHFAIHPGNHFSIGWNGGKFRPALRIKFNISAFRYGIFYLLFIKFIEDLTRLRGIDAIGVGGWFA